MRTLTVALATWREAIRQPVSIIILSGMAVLIALSQFINFYHFDEETGYNVIRQMSVASSLVCGIVIAVFSASVVLSEEIENRTVLTLLAKPVRRHEVLLGKFAGIMMAISAAFVALVAVSFFTIWWAESKVEKSRTNPCLAVRELPALTTGQGTLEVAASYSRLMSQRQGKGLDYLQSAGDFLLLSTGQSSQLVARAPLAVKQDRAEASPGLASIVSDALSFASAGTRILLEAFALAFVQVMVLAAVAVAVSTRLPLVFNGLFCTAVFVLGNLSRDLGQMLMAADTGGGVAGALFEVVRWPAAALCFLLPNFGNFNLTEALSVGLVRVPAGCCLYGVLYGLLYTVLVLAIGVLMFRRREVA